ncbi:hypothetical protein M20_0427 [Lactococcus lactis subsp. lactis]|uniref:Transposase n=1 Tax=Lactococcus lactis subsp. lactis TaxID=1360 RepID=A0A0V8EAN5_LACLL|nr:hypothetical protein M20_0427 [Lactococcus lactis subsp. lactis]
MSLVMSLKARKKVLPKQVFKNYLNDVLTSIYFHQNTDSF